MGYIFWLNMLDVVVWPIIAGGTVISEGCRMVCHKQEV
jgi:hypothetical protein